MQAWTTAEMTKFAIIWTIYAATPPLAPTMLDKTLALLRFDNLAGCEVAKGLIMNRMPSNVELYCEPYLASAPIARDLDPRTIPEVLR
jgi:hypothetical protein